MALLESVKIPLGTTMPAFELKDPYGKFHKSSELFGERGLLVVFTCNHCPYALAVWPRLVRLARYGRGMRVNCAAINPNINPDYPDDAPDKMILKIKELGIDFPYLVDDTQQVAEAFKAQCTPDIYLFDKNKALVYHGRIDDNWKDEDAVRCEELKEAMNNMAAGRPISSKQTPSMGCSIKWKG
ncbi:MAG: thioredoxin family protein [Candidatus Omnitrophica bacterium]|nr:thioredoxin family protein [Candidatus Omnitrophota bacterium]MDE2214286.1 thioredoxin family protein [Candidatus Omnitrophota bacterium]MDE2231323.1 thioredoxin family protein [Candidatus Omnitrophota bacterium]